jgi:FixJ family two-component response regulator
MRVENARATIFLLDDEPSVQAVVGRVLERKGFSVYASALWSDIGRELMAMRSPRPPLLVSDLNLPGIRGEDFCRTLLKYRPSLGLVLYTGVSEVEAAAAAKRLANGVRWVLKRDGATKLCEVLEELELKTADRGVTS